MRMPTVHPKTEEREADKFKMSMRKKIWRLICGSHWYRSQKLVQFPSLLLSCGIVYWLRIFPCADIYHCNWGKNTGFLWGCSFPDCPGNIISLGWTHGSENKCVGVISLFCYCSFYIWESLFLSPAFCSKHSKPLNYRNSPCGSRHCQSLRCFYCGLALLKE